MNQDTKVEVKCKKQYDLSESYEPVYYREYIFTNPDTKRQLRILKCEHPDCNTKTSIFFKKVHNF